MATGRLVLHTSGYVKGGP